MLKKIIEDYSLNCTVKEFKDYMNTIKIDTTDLEKLEPEVHTFDELYNWHKIQNPWNWKYYYTLQVWGRNFVQYIVPYIWWNQPINDNNLKDIIKTHKDRLIQEYINSEKFRETVKYFRNK